MKNKKPQDPTDSAEFEIIDDDEATVVNDNLNADIAASRSHNQENSAEVDVNDLKAQLQKAANDLLYMRAEFDNFRKQSIRERAELLKYGGERMARDLLDTLDIFETALSNEVTHENYQTFVEGIKLTAHQLSSTMQKYGITEIPSEGKAFDPTIHEALASEPTDKVPPGFITKIFKKAYKYHDKILRIGQVVVAKAKD
jgi:molecular chaperone GrpE